MSRPITDDQMRSLWRRRCQARNELANLGGYPRGFNRRQIRDFTHDERKTMRRCEYAIFWATKDLERGLRQRGGYFEVTPGFPLVLDLDGSLVPYWPGWKKSWGSRTAGLDELVEWRRGRVAC